MRRAWDDYPNDVSHCGGVESDFSVSSRSLSEIKIESREKDRAWQYNIIQVILNEPLNPLPTKDRVIAYFW